VVTLILKFFDSVKVVSLGDNIGLVGFSNLNLGFSLVVY